MSNTIRIFENYLFHLLVPKFYSINFFSRKVENFYQNTIKKVNFARELNFANDNLEIRAFCEFAYKFTKFRNLILAKFILLTIGIAIFLLNQKK